MNDGPDCLRRSVEVPPQQLDLTPGELRADQGASITDHRNRTGTAEPKIELVERQQDRERDEGKRADRSRYAVRFDGIPQGLSGPSGNNLTLCIQYRDPNWKNCWFKDTNRFHSSGSKSTKTSTNGAKVVLMLLHCSKNDWSAAEIWRNHWCENGPLQPVNIEGLNILLSWVSCERLTVKSGDITNAYFQGCPLERLILMRQPPGGVPDVGISADTMFVARVPIYGTCDAGRGFLEESTSS